MGVYQLLYMDKVPDNAAVSTSVDIAQKIGKGMLKGYINGVLRNISRNKNIEYPKDKIEYLSVKYSYPAFFVKELVDDILQREEVCTLRDGVVATHLKDVCLRHNAHGNLSCASTLDNIAHRRVDNELHLDIWQNIERHIHIHHTLRDIHRAILTLVGHHTAR